MHPSLEISTDIMSVPKGRLAETFFVFEGRVTYKQSFCISDGGTTVKFFSSVK